MKSVDKLRELADKLDEAAARMSEHGFSPIGLKTKIVCDEIEREIAERYMELPVDADGVPIRVGDELVFANKGYSGIVQALNTRMVIAMHVDSDYLNYAKNGLLWDSVDCRHVKPRTLEDVLTDFILSVREDADLTNGVARNVDKYAAEIRELLGGDAQ